MSPLSPPLCRHERALHFGALLFGAAATLAALTAHERLRRTPHCGWCATASGRRTSDHDARQCRGYVQERRRERLRDIAHGRTVPETNPWGEAWLTPEEITQQAEADA
ncbi:hypothetical protein STRCI_008638 [Streptomyces cinnabarinus]|uniref:Uncharacterized protein n=1 Tax=Streptomyces cinnabarinus TaxID=67287 RepID=A0ABY7KSF8_9ACTN|nr:hypothetical protein [Streptomyces cinnabarinus]WAZ26948.1 hypothetical protein STRCI_008638 [Streptomyces cinnabarinus]